MTVIKDDVKLNANLFKGAVWLCRAPTVVQALE